MSNQLQITGGAKVRNLEGVLTGTSGVVSSLGINVPSGIPQLDGSGKILVSQLPNSVMEYKGTWDASTNTPTLVDGTGNAGDVYLCNVAGTVNFGSGPITFYVGDQVLYSGTIWQRASGASGTVSSVAVTESGDALTITGSPITTSGTINIGFAGTGSQYIKGDGTLATFPTTIDQAKRLITEVYNSTGATLSKGTVVYINGGQGNLPTVTKAQANADNTSAQTYGVVQSDITNMNNGFVVVFGSLTDLDTQAYAVGTQLYLSGTTAGAWTSTKPSAPIHLVYVGIVVRSHPTQGVVEIRIQNGYELEELHDVAISAPVNNQGIFYNSSTDLWENKSIATVLGYTPANAATTLTINGTTYDISANRTWNVGTVTGSGSADQVAYWNSASGLTYDSTFYYSSSNKRLGVNTNTPNATIGSNIGIDSGFGLLVKNADNNYNGLGIGIDSSYGNLISSVKIGTAATRNITVLNQTGYHSLTEAGNFGLNILTPTASPSGVGSLGIDVYGGSNAAGIGFHNAASGVGNTNGAYIYLTTGLGFTLRNLEGGITSSSLGDFSVITNSTENFRVNASDGSLWQSNITSSLLKTNSGGVIVPAVAGTDYQTPITNPVSGTGTATRVAFWSASNTLSSNTNLYWDNTNARLGIGLTNPQRALEIYSLTADSHLRLSGAAPSVSMGEAIIGSTYQAKFGLATLSNQFVAGSSAGDFVITNQAGNILFGFNGDEKMRITSAGLVGIGTTTTAGVLNLYGAKSQLVITGNTTNGAGILLNNTISGTNRRNWGIFTEQNVDGDFVIKRSDTAGGSATSGTTILSILNTGAATFSSSVGIGGTTITDSNLLNIIGDSSSVNIGVVLNNTNATNAKIYGIQNVSKNLVFYDYSSNAARMTITNTGNVGIGTSSPSGVFHAQATNSGVVFDLSTAYTPKIKASGTLSDIQIESVGNGGNIYLYAPGNPSIITFSTAATERMRIYSGGEIGIKGAAATEAAYALFTNEANTGYFNIYAGGSGTATKGMKLKVTNGSSTIDALTITSGGNVSIGGDLALTPTDSAITFSSGAGRFFTGGAERMRITSGGNVLIGTTTDPNSGKIAAYTSDNNWTIYARNTAGSGAAYGFLCEFPSNINNVSSYYYYGGDGSAARFSVRGNGGIYNYSANNVNLSDISTKKDIIPCESYWDKFKAIEIVKFKYKDQTHDDYNIGVIAQQVEQIAPEFIDEEDWATPDGESKIMKAVYTEDLHHATIKVLQEAMVKIEMLEAKVKQLENK